MTIYVVQISTPVPFLLEGGTVYTPGTSVSVYLPRNPAGKNAIKHLLIPIAFRDHAIQHRNNTDNFQFRFTFQLHSRER